MESVRQYLLIITVCGILCSMLQAFFQKKGAISGIMKLMTSLFLTLSLLSPWLEIRIDDFLLFWEDLSEEAGYYSEGGTEIADTFLEESIKKETQTYILDKASALQHELKVEVILSKSNPPVPEYVILSGTVSPYAKKKMSEIIKHDLGISEENQIWK